MQRYIIIWKDPQGVYHMYRGINNEKRLVAERKLQFMNQEYTLLKTTLYLKESYATSKS